METVPDPGTRLLGQAAATGANGEAKATWPQASSPGCPGAFHHLGSSRCLLVEAVELVCFHLEHLVLLPDSLKSGDKTMNVDARRLGAFP